MAKDVVERESASGGWVQATRGYLEDVLAELRKVTFPQRKEAVAGTVGVIVVVGVITLVLGVVDMVLAWGVGKVLP
ncbi:MAG: preprotein translocase subunit SecE [Deltaproteobacteria bacterium]|nr:preprotein translocase subunit SecE [Deltaproteobacteria bacterium]